MSNVNYDDLIKHRNSLNYFAKLAGVKTVEVREGYAKCELELKADHFNVINSVHGGALYTLMDSVGGATACSYGDRVTTLNSSCFFLNAVREPITLYGIGRIVKKGNKISVVDVRVEDITGKLYTQGTFTFFNLKTPLEMQSKKDDNSPQENK